MINLRYSNIGACIVEAIQSRAERKRLQAMGPLGDFYRAGGSDLLYRDLPLSDSDLVLDVGGYKGEWTAGIMTRYGCRSEIFEPVTEFATQCRALYQLNTRVNVNEHALGASNRTTQFSLLNNGTSEFKDSGDVKLLTAEVRAISDVLTSLDKVAAIKPGPGGVGVLKLNIEGGEYEVLESLIETGAINRMRCLLIQFHPHPADWEQRYKIITDALTRTHKPDWCYPLIWERWALL
ncbi:MAG: FkbM family methyltransferase [Gallionella sp.]|nr:FkbM family methyltransferase [Gallionella sp.]